MDTTAVENRKTEQEIFHNFRVTKNIPLDSRFVVNSLSSIDDELPIKQRYDGLIFFIEDAVLNGITGNHYYFGTDLTTPIPLMQAIISGVVQQITVPESSYSNLNTFLNATNSIAGNIVTIKPLDITAIFDGTSWKFLAGKYKITTESVWTNIPSNLKEPGQFVKIGTITFIEKIILPNLTLSININNRFGVFSVTLVKGKNQITHNFSSTYISCTIRIYNIENPNEQDNQISIPKFEILDNNNIYVISSFDDVDVDVYIEAHKIE